jgi:flavin reductase (DIM6/NTAB) family NADH-FMN oxidoreductase RutF
VTKTVRFEIDRFYFHYPAGATIVTSSAGGRANAMAVAWHTAISQDPPLYLVCISPNRYSHGLVLQSGEFVVNFMSGEQGVLVAAVAGCSGKDIDKFDAFSIAANPGSQVQAPVLNDAYAAYECRVVDRRSYGGHDLFVGEIVAAQWEPSAFREGSILDLEHRQPIVYLGDDYYATASQVVHLERNVGVG